MHYALNSFANSWPLWWGIVHDSRPDESHVIAPPVACAEMLRGGSADVALVASIELMRMDEVAAVPRIGVVAGNEVRSVLLLSRVRFDEIRTVRLDAASRTANALAEILLRERGAVEIEDQGDADAEVVIGDRALQVWYERSRGTDSVILSGGGRAAGSEGSPATQPVAAASHPEILRRASPAQDDNFAQRAASSAGIGAEPEVPRPSRPPTLARDDEAPARDGGYGSPTSAGRPGYCYDLAAEWHSRYGEPFVFALWGVREERKANAARILRRLEESRAYGAAHLGEIAVKVAEELKLPERVAVEYFREAVHYEIGDAEHASLTRFQQLARKYRLIEQRQELRWLQQ